MPWRLEACERRGWIHDAPPTALRSGVRTLVPDPRIGSAAVCACSFLASAQLLPRPATSSLRALRLSSPPEGLQALDGRGLQA
eukprot:tig00020564_g11426.t1